MDLVVRQQTLFLSRRRWPAVSTCDHSFCYLGWASSRFLVSGCPDRFWVIGLLASGRAQQASLSSLIAAGGGRPCHPSSFAVSMTA